MGNGFGLRSATEGDAAAIAEQRGLMFLDMKLVSVEEAEILAEASGPWFSRLLLSGDYKGWLLEKKGSIVAGGGLYLRESAPVPGCLRVGRSAHIANVYIYPAHRRLGLARRLMSEMLQWCAEAGIDHVTLTASEEGRNLYASLGFQQADDMKLLLARS